MAKALLSLLCALLLALPTAQALPTDEQEPLELRVYLYDPCGGCASADTGCRDCAVVSEVLGRLIAQHRARYEDGSLQIKVRNLMYEPIRKEQQAYLKAFEVPQAQWNRLPLYLVGEPGWGDVLIGEESEQKLTALIPQVMSRMPADAAWRRSPQEGQQFIAPRSDCLEDIGPQDSLIVYFYKDYCPYCKELEDFFAALPEAVTLADGTVSRVRFISLEKQIPAQMKVVQRFYDTLFVHPDRQYVPMIIIGRRALFLKDEIESDLLPALMAGEGLDTNRDLLTSLMEKR